MVTESQTALLYELIQSEIDQGCTMACDSLIEIAIRRWKSYSRRHPKHRNPSLADRSNDVLKAFVASFKNYEYVPNCLQHLAESIAQILNDDSKDVESSHLEKR